MVLVPNACVEPHTVLFVSGDASFAGLTMVRAGFFYHFALEADVLGWHFLQKVAHFELASLSFLYVSGLRSPRDDETQQ